MVEKSFSELADEFNTSAKGWTTGDVTTELVITRYALLMRHKAQSPEDRALLCDKLFDTTLEQMSRVLALADNATLNPLFKTQMARPLETLATEGAIDYIPQRAPARLASMGLAVLDKVEKMALSTEDTNHFVDIAKLALQYADKFQAVITSRTFEISTTQDIVPSKRITLKQKPPQQAA